MADLLDRSTDLDMSGVGDVATAISTLAWTHGVTAAAEPVDAFADATARLCDTEVTFDHTEQRVALHAAYLQQQAGDVRPVR